MTDQIARRLTIDEEIEELLEKWRSDNHRVDMKLRSSRLEDYVHHIRGRLNSKFGGNVILPKRCQICFRRQDEHEATVWCAMTKALPAKPYMRSLIEEIDMAWKILETSNNVSSLRFELQQSRMEGEVVKEMLRDLKNKVKKFSRTGKDRDGKSMVSKAEEVEDELDVMDRNDAGRIVVEEADESEESESEKEDGEGENERELHGRTMSH